MHDVIRRLRGKLIVSCQSIPQKTSGPLIDPFQGPSMMAAMAVAAVLGGAGGIRANGRADIEAIKEAVHVPVIGIKKAKVEGYEVYITPTLEDAMEVASAGADIIALDCTARPHPCRLSVRDFIAKVKECTGKPVMADISTFEEGLAAAEAGADIVATTLAGYTTYSPATKGPDIDLVARLAATLQVPVMCEGRVSCPREARMAIEAGAYAVVVGTMITSPRRITEEFSKAICSFEHTGGGSDPSISDNGGLLDE